MVVPEQISDDDMILLARDISNQIEENLDYPGQIKVNVIRESRVVDYAEITRSDREIYRVFPIYNVSVKSINKGDFFMKGYEKLEQHLIHQGKKLLDFMRIL